MRARVDGLSLFCFLITFGAPFGKDVLNATVGIKQTVFKKQESSNIRNYYSMSTTTKTLIFLIVLCLVDVVIPVPILGLILIYVVFQRPPWFMEMVSDIYNPK